MGKRKKIVQERDDIAESVAQKNEKRVKQKVAKVSKKLVSAPLNEESDEAGSESGSKEFECSSEYIEAHDEESEKSNDNISGTDNDESGESSDDNSGDEQNIRQKRKKGKKDDPSKEARTIFIGNVPISVTTKELKKKFQQFGKIESIRFRGVIPSKPTIAPKVAAIKKGELSDKHRNSSIAYIVFKEEAECNKALSM
ncbi:RNA-binding protein 34-like isoform X1 [Leptotrombidium deliense]|uniref:RNA-binding protein 34-like isoform X1 n=1 Tax=Leptotrombidium deliense TaxID=299467 RepID=A0A443S7N1_9ACAR|nr:RNA-binding protein 34-like isoform X1 [Leptotrombidium deliense]